jgi:translation initiation factor 4A
MFAMTVLPSKMNIEAPRDYTKKKTLTALTNAAAVAASNTLSKPETHSTTSTTESHSKQQVESVDEKESLHRHQSKPDWDQEIKSFDDLDLREEILRGIYGYGFELPSAIQKKAIRPITYGFDCIIQAQSGTGKTGTFTIGALQLIDTNLKKPQALILAPTRELASQIHDVLNSLGRHMQLRSCLFIGGTKVYEDERSLRSGPQIVVGTPGRIQDLIDHKYLRLDACKLFVLDEADEMLGRGFQEAIYNMFQSIPKDAQVVLCSATMSPETLDLSTKFMRDPKLVLVKAEELTLEGIQQFYVAMEHEGQKLEALCDLYETVNIAKSIIY